MRGHNICFHGEIRKIIFELSSIPPLIWSSNIRLSDFAVHYICVQGYLLLLSIIFLQHYDISLIDIVCILMFIFIQKVCVHILLKFSRLLYTQVVVNISCIRI